MMRDLDIEENDLEEDEDDEALQTVDVGEFNSHDYEEFLVIWEKHECFSVVFLQDGSLRLVIDRGENCVDVYVPFEALNNGVKKNGMTYNEFEYDVESTAPAEHSSIHSGCAMLPLLGSNKSDSGTRFYTIIRSDWRVWDGEGFNYISL